MLRKEFSAPHLPISSHQIAVICAFVYIVLIVTLALCVGPICSYYFVYAPSLRTKPGRHKLQLTGAGVKGLSCVAGDFPRGRQLRCDNELCTSLGVTMQ